jgi:hypothetical protein
MVFLLQLAPQRCELQAVLLGDLPRLQSWGDSD